MQKELKFTIITPTILRPTFDRTCESIDSQLYKNWHHVVIVDDPLLKIPSNNPHPNRSWFKCDTNHHNVGNTCRSQAYDFIPPRTDYILYLDDDAFLVEDGLAKLYNKLIYSGLPEWGTFTILQYGKLFCHPKPSIGKVDTNQLYHKPVVSGRQARYIDIDRNDADGMMAEWLTKLCDPVVFSDLDPIVETPLKSHGAPNPLNPFAVVIPNKFPDVIKPLLESIRLNSKIQPNIFIVADGHDNSYDKNLVKCDQDSFIFSKAANAGIKASVPHDVILVNDDVRLLDHQTFQSLFLQAYSDPSIGILSPLIDGGCGNVYMDYHRRDKLWSGEDIIYRPGTPTDYISFVCVYLKRQMLNQVGPMDESFTGYGRDDADMCIRAVKAGWKIAITSRIKVRHGEGGPVYKRGLNWSTSYHRAGINDKGSEPYFFSKYPTAPRTRNWPQPYTSQTPMRTIPGTSWRDRLANGKG
jgi:glycosyltransferase involved in cell wall biosynthesis